MKKIIVLIMLMLFLVTPFTLVANPPVKGLSWGSSVNDGMSKLNSYGPIRHNLIDEPQGAVKGLVDTGLLQLINQVNRVTSIEKPFQNALKGPVASVVIEAQVSPSQKVILVYDSSQKLFQAAVIFQVAVNASLPATDPNRLKTIKFESVLAQLDGSFTGKKVLLYDQYKNEIICQWSNGGTSVYGIYDPLNSEIKLLFNK